MMVVVLDASAVLTWLLPSQATARGNRLLEKADEYEFIAPDVFQWEVANVLLTKARRGSISIRDALDLLAGVEITFDHPLVGEEVRQLMDVAAVSGLSLFDAAYLALAIEQDAGLASRDGVLLKAAAGMGVDVVDLRG
jgi:predicted nucleic acid-binding protein